jgi:hypothetical protein
LTGIGDYVPAGRHNGDRHNMPDTSHPSTSAARWVSLADGNPTAVIVVT